MNAVNSILPDIIPVNLTDSPPKRQICHSAFYSDVVDELKLSPMSLVVLKKYIGFVISGRMKSLPAPHDKYFWVDYSYFAADCYLTERVVKNLFAQLCGRFPEANKNLMYPLILQTKCIKGYKGTQCYYAFQEECGKVLIPFQISPRLEELKKYMTSIKLIEAGNELQAKGSRIINSQVEELITTLLSITIKGRDSKPLFIDRTPSNFKGKYTKQLQKAAKHIHEIYEGKFFRENNIEEEFWDRNQSTGGREEIQERLRAVKGSWEKTSQLLILAARNYRQWLWSDRQPENKEWLPRNIQSWIYDAHFKTSLFAASIVNPPEPLNNLVADRIYDSKSLTDEMALLAKSLYQPGYDAVQYWARIKAVGEWYDERKKLLCEIDSGCGYWFDGGKSKWFARYIEWLKDLAGGEGATLSLRNFGPENATWIAFCKQGMKLHGIEIEMWQDIDVLRRSARK